MLDRKQNLKKTQNGKSAGPVWMSLFMNGTWKCKLPPTLPSNTLSIFQHLNMKMKMCSYVGGIKWNLHLSHSLNPKYQNACALHKKTMGGTKQNMVFWVGIRGLKTKRQMGSHIHRVILLYKLEYLNH
jgi:hypothetical protein